jgi:hypothetical protein
MITWLTVYEGERGESKTVEADSRASVLSQFDAADRSGILRGRAVRCMWLIDGDGDRGDIIRRHGVVAPEIEARYRKYLASTRDKLT